MSPFDINPEKRPKAAVPRLLQPGGNASCARHLTGAIPSGHFRDDGDHQIVARDHADDAAVRVDHG
jgi:hypothetical protein